MERQGDEVHIETDEARGASTPNIVRWVLGISLFAAIVLLSVIWIAGAATQGEDPAGDPRERALQDYGSQRGVLAGTGDNAEAAQTNLPASPPVIENTAETPAPAPTAS
jgi:nitrogen fixation-related uncharacterized protein